MFKKILLLLVLSLVLTSCDSFGEKIAEVENEKVAVVEDLSPDRVFVDKITNTDFENLKIEDFPSMIQNYNWPESVVWKNRVFFLSYPNIMEYDLKGNFVSYTNLDLIPCSTEMALINDSLFIACRDIGIYEVNLNSNRIVYVYDNSNGLVSLQNPKLTADGDTLWFGTFDGIYRINTKTHEVKGYLDELAVGGAKVQGRVYARNGDVWAHVIASGSSAGGLAHYNYKTDSWKMYGPVAFKTPGSLNKYDYDRIDFDEVIVSDDSVYVRYQDQGTEKVAIRKFDPKADVWNEIYSAQYMVFEENYKKYLPSTQTYVSYRYENSLDSGLNFEIYNNSKWLKLPIEYVQFSGLYKVGDIYYLVSHHGIYTFSKGDKLPKLLTKISGYIYGGSSMSVFVTDDNKYVVYVDVVGGEMGFGASVAVGAYELATGKLVEQSVDITDKDFGGNLDGIVGIFDAKELISSYANGVVSLSAKDFGAFTFDISSGKLSFVPKK